MDHHQWHYLTRICVSLRRKVPHWRTHSLAPNNTSACSSHHQILSQFLSRDPPVLCLILVLWIIRRGRIQSWALQKKKPNQSVSSRETVYCIMAFFYWYIAQRNKTNHISFFFFNKRNLKWTFILIQRFLKR